jgi:hypothetical protein
LLHYLWDTEIYVDGDSELYEGLWPRAGREREVLWEEVREVAREEVREKRGRVKWTRVRSATQ